MNLTLIRNDASTLSDLTMEALEKLLAKVYVSLLEDINNSLILI